MTVDAGIHVSAETVTGIFHHFEVFIGEIMFYQFDAQLGGGLAGRLGSKERGDEAEAYDLDALFHDGLGGQDAVQASGK